MSSVGQVSHLSHIHQSKYDNALPRIYDEGARMEAKPAVRKALSMREKF